MEPDCTLACENGHLTAHKPILCSHSNYLNEILSKFPNAEHSIIILTELNIADVKVLVNYMYTGELVFTNDSSPISLSRAAQILKIDSLTDLEEDEQQQLNQHQQTATTGNNNNNNNNINDHHRLLSGARSHHSQQDDDADLDEDLDMYEDDEPTSNNINNNNTSNNNNNNNNNNSNHNRRNHQNPATSLSLNRSLSIINGLANQLNNNNLNLNLNLNGNNNNQNNNSINNHNSSADLDIDLDVDLDDELEQDDDSDLEYERSIGVLNNSNRNNNNNNTLNLHQLPPQIQHALNLDVKDNVIRCKLCNIGLSDVKCLYRHVLTRHLPEKLGYKCEFCERQFSRDDHLMRHYTTKHANMQFNRDKIRETRRLNREMAKNFHDQY